MHQSNIETESDTEMVAETETKVEETEIKIEETITVQLVDLDLASWDAEMHCEFPDAVSTASLPNEDSKLKSRAIESNRAFFPLTADSASWPNFRDVTTIKAQLWLSKMRGVLRHPNLVTSSAAFVYLATALLSAKVDSRTRGKIYLALTDVAESCRHRQSLFQGGIMGTLAQLVLDQLDVEPNKDVKDLNGFLHVLCTLLVPDEKSLLTPERLWITKQDRVMALVNLQDVIKKLKRSSNKLHVYTVSYLGDLLGWLETAMIKLDEHSAPSEEESKAEEKTKAKSKEGCLQRLFKRKAKAEVKAELKVEPVPMSIDDLREEVAKAGFELAVIGESDRVSAEIDDLRAEQVKQQESMDLIRDELASTFDKAEAAEAGETKAVHALNALHLERDSLQLALKDSERAAEDYCQVAKDMERATNTFHKVAKDRERAAKDSHDLYIVARTNVIQLRVDNARLEAKNADFKTENGSLKLENGSLKSENGSLKRQLEEYADKAAQRPAKRARVSKEVPQEPTRRSTRKRMVASRR